MKMLKHLYRLFIFPIIASLGVSSDKYVTIPDTNLAAVIRKALRLGANEPIPLEKLEKLQHLDGNNRSITDLTGIVENCKKLAKLPVNDNPVQDMEPLRKLLKQIPDLELDIPAPEELVIPPPTSN